MHIRKPRRLIVAHGGVLAALCAIVWVLAWPQAGGAAPFAPPLPLPASPSAITLDKFLYLPLLLRPVVSAYDWPQYGFDAQHSGNDTSEGLIFASNVISLHRVFQQPLATSADGQPAYLSAITTISGTRDVLFVTMSDGTIGAYDAHTGVPIWQKQHGPGSCRINNNPAVICFTTSSPAVDPNRQYVYTYGLDGRAHKHAVGDGAETLSGGWPETATLKGYDEKGSASLAIATAQNGVSYLYVANGGYPGDAGDYQGHVTAINLSDGSQKVFNTLCSNQAVHFVDKRVASGPDCVELQSAVWARPGVIYNPVNDEIYFATGNGTFAPNSFHWGDSVLTLHADGTGASGKPLDSYTPVDYQNLQNTDADLGSTAPALLPPAGGKYLHMAVQGGKDGKLRLLNTDNLSRHGATGFTGGDLFSLTLPMGNNLLTQPAVWVNPDDFSTWVFVANLNGIAGLQLVIDGTGNPSLQTRWSKSGSSFQGTTPIVANGVLYYDHSNLVMARDPLTGNQLWSDNHIGTVHWSSPIVVNGMLYVADRSGLLTGYALP